MEATQARAPVKRGFCAPCPRCGAEAVRISLADLNNLECDSCEEEFDLADVRKLVEGWSAVLAWVDQAPLLED